MNGEFDEWCTDCKEYDHEKHNCPRFNRVIREALEEAQSEKKVGKWKWIVKNGMADWKCSLCGGSGRADYPFCPWCGNEMEHQ